MPNIAGLDASIFSNNNKVQKIRRLYSKLREKRIFYRFDTRTGSVMRQVKTRGRILNVIKPVEYNYDFSWAIEPDWYPMYDEFNEYLGWYQNGTFYKKGSRRSGVGV
ncbi:MAG: hypothetical protein PHT13_00895 [Methanosarcina sp.]|nr:hypothetical protein [Methanosarcina sp.]